MNKTFRQSVLLDILPQHVSIRSNYCELVNMTSVDYTIETVAITYFPLLAKVTIMSNGKKCFTSLNILFIQS